MASIEREEAGVLQYLQPELLTQENLLEILQSRCIKVCGMEQMSKTQLLDVFHRVAVPLPQRAYRENRRGKVLLKLRRKQERKRRREEPERKDNSFCYGEAFKTAKLEPLSECIKPGDSLKSPSDGDCLKPPPDQINYKRKVIKLNSVSSNCSNNIETKRTVVSLGKKDDTLDNIVIKDRRRDAKTDEEIKSDSNRTEEKLNIASTHRNNNENESGATSDAKSESSGSAGSADIIITSVRKIKLKRPSTGSSEAQENETLEQKDLPPKKQRRKITWP